MYERPLKTFLRFLSLTLALGFAPLASAQVPATKPEPALSSFSPVQVSPPLHVLIDPASFQGAGSGFPYAAVIPSAVTGLVSFAALLFTYFGTMRTINASVANSSAALWQKSNEIELSDLQAQIGEFYEVFIQISETSKLFSRELKSRQPNPSQFALLRALFDPQWRNGLSPEDKVVVQEICENGRQLETLTLNRKVPINPLLQPYFARAAAHFRILRLAFAGNLGDDLTKFGRYVYPYQLNNVVDLEMRRLRERQEKLRVAPSSPPPPVTLLIIPATEEYLLPSWPDSPREPLPAIG